MMHTACEMSEVQGDRRKAEMTVTLPRRDLI